MGNIFKIIIGLIFIIIIFKMPVVAVENIAVSSGAINVVKSEASKKNETALKIKKVQSFLKDYNSPLEPYAKTFVEKADEYNLDWKMAVAISGVESTFGKNTPVNSHNAWGWGIPTGAVSGIGFNNWENGIETVIKGLKEKYINKGADTVYKIGPIYAPPSKTWAGNVTFFMERLDAVVLPPDFSL